MNDFDKIINFINKSPINESYFNLINKQTNIFDVVFPSRFFFIAS